jgi:hypothetical protein
MYPSNTFLLLQELIRGVHHFEGGSLGHLPGDIVVERKNFTLYVPIATGLLISMVLTLLLWLVNW